MKGYEKSSHKAFILKCAAASEYNFFYVKDCVAASRNALMFFNERAAASGRYQWTTASERKNVLLRNILKWKQIKTRKRYAL